MFALIASVFPDWTDREVSNFGNILVELFAFTGDVLTFYQDNQAKESRLSDAVVRSNVLALAKMLNYVPEGNAAASADLLVTLNEVPTNDIVLAAGRKYLTSNFANPITFEQIFVTQIPAGLDPPQVIVTVANREIFEESFSSTGLPSQQIVLSSTPYLDNTAVVNATNGTYTQVDTFLNSKATDFHFTLAVDSVGRGVLTFGDGVNGQIPSDNLTVVYSVGGGASGNVDANTIVKINEPVLDVVGNRIVATATNPTAASGGVNRETTAAIKQKAPPSTKITDRTVSLDDYEIGAENIEGVARALMVTSDQVVGVAENRGFLYIVPDGGGLPSAALKSSVETELTVTRPNTITFKFEVVDPQYLAVDIVVRAYFATGQNPNIVATAINTAFNDYFQISNPDGTKNTLVKFGLKYGNDLKLPLSDLFCVAENVSGVRKIGANDVDFTVNGEHADLALTYAQFPTLNSVTVRDGETGEVVSPAV
jgi:hypothetical protein